MDSGQIKEKAKQVAEARDKVVSKTMGFVDEKTKGKGTVALFMAVLVFASLAMEQKLLAFVFGAIGFADFISALIPASKPKEAKVEVVVTEVKTEVTPVTETKSE